MFSLCVGVSTHRDVRTCASEPAVALALEGELRVRALSPALLVPLEVRFALFLLSLSSRPRPPAVR